MSSTCPNRWPVRWRGTRRASAAFDKLAFTHRKEYAEWIAEAKREETRERRAAKAIEMLRDGVAHPEDADDYDGFGISRSRTRNVSSVACQGTVNCDVSSISSKWSRTSSTVNGRVLLQVALGHSDEEPDDATAADRVDVAAHRTVLVREVGDDR